MDAAEIGATLRARCGRRRHRLVEGNKGLYDGLALDGSNSNAALARQLGLPVLLVIDARGMTRGIAPLILGYQAFDRDIRIAGVILNQLGGARHEAKLRAVIEHYTDVPVLGAIARATRGWRWPSATSGLMPAAKSTTPRAAGARHRRASSAEQVDLERVLALGGIASAGARPTSPPRDRAPRHGADRAHRHRARPRVRLLLPRRPAGAGRPRARRWCRSIRCATAPAGDRRPLHRRRFPGSLSWTNSKPTWRCAPPCARPSRTACRPTPNAAD